jgi:diguanylate cyclase
VPDELLTRMLSQSEDIRGLIQQSAAAVLSASAQMPRKVANSVPMPGVTEVLDNQAMATRQLHEAGEKLTALNLVLRREIRERTLIEHQLAATVEQEESARKAALQDQLTGLSNRVLFNDRLEHGIAQAARQGWMLAVMFVDLNAFKSINDTHRHQAGDAVLKSIAQRLANTTRNEDTVSR